MATPLEYILEKILPEVETAITDSAKRQNRIYNISVSLKQGSDNAEMKVIQNKSLPLLNLTSGLETETTRITREETSQTAIEKVKLDIAKLLDCHSEDRGKTSLTMTIREGAYTSSEWDFVEYRYFRKTGNNAKRRQGFQVK
ncbi:hypothetical protein FD723_40850 (plasmid) [Nostoc sp. C052]|uniref:hypothetical protein n=1 Tax=Nostoc sp. C052 TaxID=2576902 RepID=UPI0015C34463|nr:hypothetical protein [Nostoc sp. C052]QLE46565.1 hypothetical protein FD723_40850 [Nostoc sp. C052]